MQGQQDIFQQRNEARLSSNITSYFLKEIKNESKTREGAITITKHLEEKTHLHQHDLGLDNSFLEMKPKV